MSKAEDLLNSLTEEGKGAAYTVSSNEPHIVVGLDRFITVRTTLTTTNTATWWSVATTYC